MPKPDIDVNRAMEAADNLKNLQNQANITRQAAYQQMMGDQPYVKPQKETDPAFELQKARMAGGAGRLLAGTFGGKYIGNVPIFASIDTVTPFASINQRNEDTAPPMKWKEVKVNELGSTNKRYGDYLNQWHASSMDNYISGLNTTFGHGLASGIYNNDAYPEGRQGNRITSTFKSINHKLGLIEGVLDTKGDAELSQSSFLPDTWFKYREHYRDMARDGESMKQFLTELETNPALLNDFLNSGDVASNVESLTKNHMKDYFRNNQTALGWSNEDMAKINAGDFSLLYTKSEGIDPDDLIAGLEHKLRGTNADVYTLSKEIDPTTGRFRRTVGGKINLVSVISGMFPGEFEHKYVQKAKEAKTNVTIIDKGEDVVNYTATGAQDNFTSYIEGVWKQQGEGDNASFGYFGVKDRNINLSFTPTNKSGAYGVSGGIMTSINQNGSISFVSPYNYNAMTGLLRDVYSVDYPNQTPSQLTNNMSKDGAGYLFGQSIGGQDPNTVKGSERALTNFKHIFENVAYEDDKLVRREYTFQDKADNFFNLTSVPLRRHTDNSPGLILTGANFDEDGGLNSISLNTPEGDRTSYGIILKNQYLNTPTQDMLQNVISNVSTIGVGGKDYTVLKGAKLIKEKDKYLVVTVNDDGTETGRIPLEVNGQKISLNPNEMQTIINGHMAEAHSQLFNANNWDSKTNSLRYRPMELQQTIVQEPKLFFTSSKWSTAVPPSGLELSYMKGRSTSENFNLLNAPMQAQTTRTLTLSEMGGSQGDREFMSLINAFGKYTDPTDPSYNKTINTGTDFITWYKGLDDNIKQKIIDGGLVGTNVPLYDIFNKAGFYKKYE
tara:strand:+ start:56 stop:2566 length:2511 start_codon:yes stop_codon:yes gene_type:complete